jgi:hypothetical protein
VQFGRDRQHAIERLLGEIEGIFFRHLTTRYFLAGFFRRGVAAAVAYVD